YNPVFCCLWPFAFFPLVPLVYKALVEETLACQHPSDNLLSISTSRTVVLAKLILLMNTHPPKIRDLSYTTAKGLTPAPTTIGTELRSFFRI
ncbi:hypothetical protein B0H34DRAFT_725913, partial [Crassisporium funariophilum]